MYTSCILSIYYLYYFVLRARARIYHSLFGFYFITPKYLDSKIKMNANFIQGNSKILIAYIYTRMISIFYHRSAYKDILYINYFFLTSGKINVK
jgi:hypothetical protein